MHNASSSSPLPSPHSAPRRCAWVPPADAIAWHGRPCSLQATLPPLSAVFFVPEEQKPLP